MKFTRITVVKNHEVITEYLKATPSQAEALDWYRKKHPEFSECILIAETVESDSLTEDYLKAYAQAYV